MSRPAIDTLAAQLSASLSELSAALRKRLTEPLAPSSSAVEAPPTESPFRKPSAPADRTAELAMATSGNAGLLGAVVAALRRLIGTTPEPRPVPTRPTKRFRTARHRVRKH